ncbi:HNH endonuclease signature motif containing protein [Knoellia locipacati]|uniref:HNH endonuclease n=1 Tax=Knoellia locipacati TaxID=882824 RepID=A0A512SWZ3_9MICO|nr:HNH endonuclease signature motif containing protein [Knoellia locipacati]GEQ12461.1 HNH endonuclease [Knoellia locipacati]
MEATSASAAHEGRYAVLLAEVAGLSTQELLEVIEDAQREKDAASARQAVALAHLSAREPHLLEDGTTVEVHHGVGHQRMDAPELAAPRMGVSVHVATRRVSQAIDQLTRTPAVVDAMACGDLDEQRAAAVTEETEFLTAESAAAVIGLVAPRWSELTVGPLRRLLARAAAIVDPDAVAAHAEDERSRRGLTRRVGSHGTDAWRGEFLVEQSRAAWAAVTELARRKVREGSAPTLEIARADALMELVLDHSDVSVVVHTTRAATDEAAPATSATSGNSTDANAGSAFGSDEDPGPAAPSCADGLMEVGGLGAPGTTFVRRAWVDDALAAADSALDQDSGLVCDPDTGALLSGDVPASLASGRTRRSNRAGEDASEAYRIPAAMARLVRLRDGSCRFPGCSTPARLCDLDHVRPWPLGPTSAANLIALCRHHHRIKQRTGWTLRLHPDRTVTWRDPTGHESTTWPVDHLHLATATRSSTPAPTPGPHVPPPSTFEDELAALLEHEAIPLEPRAHPKVWDARGRLICGPPPRIDTAPGHLTHPTTGRHHTLVLDLAHRRHRPYRSTADPEAIPF